jgi:hypothetical protein
MKFCYLLLTLPWIVVPAANAQAAYYVERYGVVTTGVEGNPEREHPGEWRIRLYQPQAPRSGAGWGQIVGQSADDAQEELHRSQEFEGRLRRFCGTDSQSEIAQYTNFLGPIAVYEAVQPTGAKAAQPVKNSDPAPVQSEVFDLADRITELENDFLAATEEKRVQAQPSRYPFAIRSAPWIFATTLAETKKEFEESNALASSGSLSSSQISDARMKVKNAIVELETNLLLPMRKALANVSFEGRWQHRGITYVSTQNGKQLSLKAETPDGLRFRNIDIESDVALSGEIEFIYDNGCEPIWQHFTAALTFDTEAEGILITVPRVGREKSTCKEVTQGSLRMMFWRPEQ